MNKKHYKYALYFFLLQLLIVYYTSTSQLWHNLFWYCNHAPLLFALGFLIKDKNLVHGLINVGLIGQTVWLVDFLFEFVFGVALFSLASYIFTDERPIFILLIPVVAHIFSTMLALYLIRKEEISRKSLIYSFGYIAVLFLITRIFTLRYLNVNCVYDLCIIPEMFEIPFYPMVWFIVTIIVVIIPSYYFQKIITKKIS